MSRLRSHLAGTVAAALIALAPAGLTLPRLVAAPVTAGVLEYTTSPQKVVPSNGCTNVTPSGSAFGNSAWVELIASTSTDIVVTGVAVDPAVDGGEWQVDLGTGAAAAETSLGEVARAQNVNEGRAGTTFVAIKPGVFIATGTRVAFRMRKFGTNTSQWCFAFTYHEAPLTGQATYVSGAAIRAAFGGVSTTPSGSTWGNSAWYEETASTATNIVITGFTSTWLCIGGDGYDYEWDIGTGGAGSETVKHTIRNAFFDTNGICTLSGGMNYTPIWPGVRIASGTRVALRQRKEGTSTGAMFPSLSYVTTDSGLSTIYTAAASTIVPAAANGHTISSKALFGSGATYVEFIASTASAIAVTGMTLRGATSDEHECDIATGASASEVVKGTYRAMTSSADGDFHLSIRPALDIPTSTRVAVRCRTDSGADRTVAVNLHYIASPDFDQRSSNTASVYPLSAAGVSVTPSGSAWNNSSWGQLTASTSTSILVTGLAFRLGGGAPRGLEVDLGTGGAGSETVITTARAHFGGGDSTHGSQVQLLEFTYPPYVPPSTRVAVRMRGAGTNTTAFRFAVNYVEYTPATNGPFLFSPYKFCCRPMLERPGAR